MKVEISKTQKEALSQKVDLCVNFIKTEVQPHLVRADKLTIPMGEVLDLCITSKEIYAVRTRVVSVFIDLYFKTVLKLEKQPNKKVNKYICEGYPELAVEFLKHWDKAKAVLIDEVLDKNKKISDFDKFVDSFQL